MTTLIPEIASIADEGQATVPAPFGVALSKLAAQRPEIVGMTADLSKYTDLHIFAQAFPDRFFQMGMAEQLLMAAAGGMAKEGFIPFATTYAAFATRRAYDFIHQVIAEEHLNVKICAALPGLTTGYGPSHQATEDLAIMRGIPGMVIVDPCDALEIEQAVPAIADHQGPVYMRLLRGKVPLVLDKYDYQFELGKAKLLVGVAERALVLRHFGFGIKYGGLFDSLVQGGAGCSPLWRSAGLQGLRHDQRTNLEYQIASCHAAGGSWLFQ